MVSINAVEVSAGTFSKVFREFRVEHPEMPWDNIAGVQIG
jgi:hypothetical protein